MDPRERLMRDSVQAMHRDALRPSPEPEDVAALWRTPAGFRAAAGWVEGPARWAPSTPWSNVRPPSATPSRGAGEGSAILSTDPFHPLAPCEGATPSLEDRQKWATDCDSKAEALGRAFEEYYRSHGVACEVGCVGDVTNVRAAWDESSFACVFTAGCRTNCFSSHCQPIEVVEPADDPFEERGER